MRIFTTILLSLISFNLCGQTEFGHSTNPTCGGSTIIQKLNWKSDDDTAYMLHFSINSCPRCEPLVYQTAKILQLRGILPYLVIDCPTKASINDYLKTISPSAFKGIIIDTIGYFRQIVDYKREPISVPYLYKLNIKHGSFYSIQSLLGANPQIIVKQSISATKIIPCDSSAIITQLKNNKNNVSLGAGWSKVEQLPNISGIASAFRTKNSIAINDFKTLQIHILHLPSLEENIIYPNQSEYYYANDTSDAIIKDYIKENISGMLKVIYLNILSIDKNAITFTASLPLITYSIKDNDTSFYYNNLPVIVKKSFDNRLISIKKMNIPHETKYGLSYSHQESILINDSTYTLGICKGWPAVGSDFTDTNNINNNPFLNDFYKYTPRLSVIKGKSATDIGKLNDMARQMHCGYYFYSDYKLVNDSRYIYAIDPCWGTIEKYELNNLNNHPKLTAELLPNKASNIQLHNVVNYAKKMDYLVSYSKQIHKETIISVGNIDSKSLYIVVQKKLDSSSVFTTYIVDKKQFRKKQLGEDFSIMNKLFDYIDKVWVTNIHGKTQWELLYTKDDKVYKTTKL